MSDSVVNLSEILDARYYADLIECGGLVASIVHVSNLNGIDLGEVSPQARSGEGMFKTANANSRRGRMSVLLGLGRRSFSLTLEGREFVWASGGTPDLLILISAMDSWRKGASLREIGTEFPFLQYGRISQAHEDGDAVEVQWRILAESERFRENFHLIRLLQSDVRLRELFPSFSHETLRLAVDCCDRCAGEILIERHGGKYLVSASGGEMASLAILANAAQSLIFHNFS
ncbi:DUF6193 family natural product biosynthesis protein [Streptomyces lavendulae]|uniref:DUF6193 family natural product biosynthesis protein n=1 Tax=Streptomyces lavendulae TaxID=1914 RepID=UPI0033CDA782